MGTLGLVQPCFCLQSVGRCSIVDYSGRILCDIYAQPDEPITDYRTRWSGIRRRDMIQAIPVESARNIIKNIIRVGSFACFCVSVCCLSSLSYQICMTCIFICLVLDMNIKVQ